MEEAGTQKHKEEEVSTQVLGSLYKKTVRGNASA